MTNRVDAREVPLRAGFESGVMPSEVLQIGLRAMLGVLGKPKGVPESTKQLTEAVVELWQHKGGRGTLTPIDQLEPLEPHEVAARLRVGPLRVQLIRLCTVAILFDRKPDLERVARLEQLAEALNVSEPGVADVRRWASRQPLRLRRNLIVRTWAIEELRLRAAEVGTAKVFWVFISMFLRTHQNPGLLARYRKLGELPPDTLGATLIHDLRKHGFSLPGERGSAEDYMIRHDLVHALADLGTDARSEVEAGSFMAGCRGYDGFVLVVFVLLQFHCGLRVTPVARGEVGLVDPRRMLDALSRSVFMTIDPSVRAWNYEAVLAEPIDRLRERYRIAPSRLRPHDEAAAAA